MLEQMERMAHGAGHSIRLSQSDERAQRHPGDIDGKVLPTGYIVSLACGPLKKPRYINQAIEKELAEFKIEIKEKCEKSIVNKTYVFPRVLVATKSQATEEEGPGGDSKTVFHTVGSEDRVTISHLSNRTGKMPNLKDGRYKDKSEPDIIRQRMNISSSLQGALPANS